MPSLQSLEILKVFQQQLEQLKQKLIRKHLPVAYIRRVLDELRDHYEDAVADQIARGNDQQKATSIASDIIGDSDLLADAFFKRYRMHLFTGRHPWVSYIFYPMLLFVASVAVTYLAAVLVGLTIPGVARTDIPFMVFVLSLFYFANYCLPSLWAIRFSFNARNTCLGAHWAIAASSLLSLASYLLLSLIQLPVYGFFFGEFGIGTYVSVFPVVAVEGLMNTLPIITCLAFFATNHLIERKRLKYL